MIARFEAHQNASHFPKPSSQGVVFKPQEHCRLRGVWGNAQDTTPVWGSFCCEIKTLFNPCAVSPLSAFWKSRFLSNKNNGRAI